MPAPPRKKLKRFEELLGIRCLTCSCYRRRRLFDDGHAKTEFVRALSRTKAKHGFGLFAWVLMPEHFHLLLMPRLPESPVDELLTMLKGTSARRILADWRQRGLPIVAEVETASGEPRFWQPGGGHDRNVRREDSLSDLINYIHQNPVRRGLVARATDWEWSSARWHAGDKAGTIPMDDPVGFRVEEVARLIEVFGSFSAAAKAMREEP